MSIEGTSKSDNILLNSQNHWKKHFVKGNFLKLDKVGKGILLT